MEAINLEYPGMTTPNEQPKIELEENPPKGCFYCKRPTVRLRRIFGRGIPTRNTTDVCVNPNCPLYIRVYKVKDWKVEK